MDFQRTPVTPNYALRLTDPRVTARAFCERRGSYICGVSARFTVVHAPRHWSHWGRVPTFNNYKSVEPFQHEH